LPRSSTTCGRTIRADQQVSASAVRRRDAAAAQPERLPRLRARRNPQLHRSFERRHVEARAEHGLVYADRQNHAQVVSLAPEVRVRLHVHGDVQVAGAAAVPSRVSAIRNAQTRSFCDARRHDHGSRSDPCDGRSPHTAQRTVRWRPVPSHAAQPS
jgi:hypothetical protein